MKTTALVCCCGRDEKMLPLFIQQWRNVYPDSALWLGECTHDPVKDHHGLSSLPVDWEGGKTALSIARAMIDTGGDVVVKADVDAYHRAPFFTAIYNDPNIQAEGIQWLDEPHLFLGMAYAIRRSCLMTLDMINDCGCWSGQEDWRMAWLVRRSYPNGIYLHTPYTARKATTDNGTAAVVHCGCFYEADHPREEAYQAILARHRLTTMR